MAGLGKLSDKSLQINADESLVLEPLPSFSQNGNKLGQGDDSFLTTKNRNRRRGSSVASSIIDTIEHITVSNEHTDIGSKDPGLNTEEYYRKHMSNVRFKIRQFFMSYVKEETEALSFIQKHLRSFILDEYFINSANLGSHFFYVVCLPISRWIPFSDSVDYSRDVIYLLAFSIYFSGLIKDYLCLPRPKSPPIIRITHSEYTTKEYGAPSSHTGNATAVTAYVLMRLIQNINSFSFFEMVLYFGLAFIYYATLTFGRLYTGMHGFFDLESGALVGILTLILRLASKHFVDYNMLTSGSIFSPLAHVFFGFFLLFTHTHPAELCPCFEDSVAFIGVIGGLEISDWLCCNLGKKWLPWVSRTKSPNLRFLLPLPEENDKFLKIVSLRVLIGVVLVLLWKEVISVFLTKTVFKLKTTSILSHKTLKQTTVLGYEPLPYKVIILRYWIYAGISIVTCVISPLVFFLFGLV